MNGSRVRSVVICVAAAAFALTLSRRPIADSLVVRGDSAALHAQPVRALAYYRRAIRVDSADGVALDRFSFGALLQRDKSTMQLAIRLCSEFLQRNPNDRTIRFDRALLFRAIGNLERAEFDFAIDGNLGRDARALTFAGFIARSAGREHAARLYWKRALSYRPNFLPARRALSRLDSR
jgi:tetratricopeptide (TPR) repeat protein